MSVLRTTNLRFVLRIQMVRIRALNRAIMAMKIKGLWIRGCGFSRAS
jgi:hypothetical protein